MKADRTDKKPSRAWILLVILALALASAAGWLLANRRLERARAEATAPYLVITSPLQGEIFELEAPLVLRGVATGPFPILRVELYVDGELLAAETSADPAGSIPFFSSFSFRIPEGIHMLHLRGIDSEGRVGQSLPVSIQALDQPRGWSQSFIPYGPGSDPGQLGAAYGIDPDLILSSNPWFGAPDRPPEGVLVVPGGEEPGEQEPEGADSLPSLPVGDGTAGSQPKPGTTLAAVGSAFPAANATGLPWTVFLPPALPSGPEGLQAQVQDCQVRLSWSSVPDAAEFRIWMDKQDGTRLLVAKLKPGNSPAARFQYEFEPGAGGRISILVESVNALGGQSSAPVSLVLGNHCRRAGERRLHFEALQVKTSPEYDQVYFYLSFEGRPEQRFPADDSQFFGLVAGAGQVEPRFSGDQAWLLPPLGDGKLDLAGECWGWAGGEPVRIARFADTIPESEMQGQELILGGAACQLSIRLQPEDDSGSLTAYGGNLGGLPAPYNLKAEKQKQYEAYQNIYFMPQYTWLYRYTRLVSWSWDGNPADITGFTIYVNGKQAAQVQGANARQAVVVFPEKCGPPSTWGVVANGKAGNSPMSQLATLWQGPCTNYARVDFQYLVFHRTCDGRFSCGATKFFYCDTLESYFELAVNQVSRKFYSSNFPLKVNCNSSFLFKNIVTQAGGNVFLVPLFTEASSSNQPFEVVVETEFWDQDDWSGDDSFGHLKKKHGFSSWNAAVNWFDQSCYDQTGNYPYFYCDSDLVMVTKKYVGDDDANISITYALSIYPNLILKSPP